MAELQPHFETDPSQTLYADAILEGILNLHERLNLLDVPVEFEKPKAAARLYFNLLEKRWKR
jgi:hypothetical protein